MTRGGSFGTQRCEWYLSSEQRMGQRDREAVRTRSRRPALMVWVRSSSLVVSRQRVSSKCRCFRGFQRAMPRKFAWASLPDSELLKLHLKDLKVTIAGTWLERCLKDLHDELAERGRWIRPHSWVETDVFSLDDPPGIAIPFYPAHPRLMRLERKRMIDVEGGTVAACMRILRHEAGHVVQVVYQLHRRRRWRELFGPSSRRYPRY